MSEMIERVARAIYEKQQEGNAFAGDASWATGVKNKHHYLDVARAAIEAMRDEDMVTWGMLEAGRVALHAPENRHGAVLGAVFCAMIDAALEEKP